MPHRFHPKAEQEIHVLLDQASRMAALSEAILDKSLDAVWTLDARLAREVMTDDLAIDQLDVDIDTSVLQILALAAPVAADLRMVLAVKTIATDLERVGDLARNIAGCAGRLSKQLCAPLPADLHALADDSRKLLRRSIRAFAELDADEARRVLELDDAIDALEDQMVREALARLSATPDHVEQELDVIFVAQHLERIGDHATNIAEEVILAAEASNVKHLGKLSS